MSPLNHLRQIWILFELLHELVHRLYHQNLHSILPPAATGRSSSFNRLETTILQIPLFINWSRSVVNSATFGRVPPMRFLWTWMYISLSRFGVTAFSLTFSACFSRSSMFLINPHKQARRTCAIRGKESRIDDWLSRKNWNNVFDMVAIDTAFSALTMIYLNVYSLLNPSGAVSCSAFLHTSRSRRASPISATFFTHNRIAGSWKSESSVPRDSLHSWIRCRMIWVKSASEYVGKTSVQGFDERILSRGRDRSIRSMLFAIPMMISTLDDRYGHSKRSYTILRSLVSKRSTSSMQMILWMEREKSVITADFVFGLDLIKTLIQESLWLSPRVVSCLLKDRPTRNRFLDFCATSLH